MSVASYAPLTNLPAPVTTAVSGIQSFVDINGKTWVAKYGLNGGAWTRARDALHAAVYRSAAYGPPTASAVFGADAAYRDTWGLYTFSPTYAFTAPVAGFYRCSFAWGGTGAASPNYISIAILQNGVQITNDNMIQAVSGTVYGRSQALALAAAGDTFQGQYMTSVALTAGVTGYAGNRILFDYLGSS